MPVRHSSHVKCARCRRLAARENAREAGGLLYGPCRIGRALSDAAWSCETCGGLYPEEDMDRAGLCRFCAVLHFMPSPLPAKPDYQLITDPAELEVLTDRLAAEGKPVGYDIETSYDGEPRADAQKHPEENFICGFSLTNSLSWARAVPIAFESGPNIDPKLAAQCLRRLAEARDGQGKPLLVSHNAVFEMRCTARLFERFLGIPLEDAYFEVRSDTMVEAYIEAGHESYALKSLTWETFGHKMTEIMELFETPGGKKLTKFQQDSIQFHLLDPADPKVTSYMCEDALWALAHHLRRYPRVTDPSFRGAFLFKADMAQLPIICGMADTGMAYDWNMMREAAQRGQAFMGRLAAEINADLAAAIGKPVSLSLASPPQIARVLYDKDDGLGLPARHRSKKTGKPSTDKLALKQLASEHPVVKKIQAYRQIKRRVVDNYAGKYEQDYNYAPDGRAHPNILYTAAVTGRFAFSRPAAQQPPKTSTWTLESGETFTFPWRDFITVPPPGAMGDTEHRGWYILGFDWGQAELRALAGEAQEAALLEAYERGEDVHRLTASRMLGVPLGEVTEEIRGVGKTLNFSIAYQLTASSLAERLGVPKDEGQRLYDAWFAAYPRIREWTERTVAQARRDGYTMSRFGRRHPIWEFAKVCQFCQDRGVLSKWTSGDHRCPRCGGLGTPRSKAVIAHGERLAGNAPIQGGATGDAMRVAMLRADRALREAGLDRKVRLFLNVHDSLDFYVRKDVPPGEVIRVLQPAVVFPVKGWPPMVADWHAGMRMGSLAELEVGPDFSVKRKGVRAEAPVPGDDDEDDEAVLPAVDLSAVFAVTAKTEETSHEQVPEVPAPAQTAEPGGLGDPGGLGSGDDVRDNRSRTVIITVPQVPAAAGAKRLCAALARLPGPNTVILRTPPGDVPVPGTSGLTPGHQADVAFILPGAEVTYDAASVDYAAIAEGITVLRA
jgi:DNA polymerase I-like protein with 3'-5' exonuclease and polymerase domains